MVRDSKIRQILVVVDPETLVGERSRSSPPLSRALEVAKATNARLELFWPCFESSLDQGLFASDTSVLAEKQVIVDQKATRMAEVAAGLADGGFEVGHAVRWGHSPVDAILHRIAELGPDIVMKGLGDSKYLVGLVDTTDWGLARRSPCHVWFVKTAAARIERILTAVGSVVDEEVISEADYEVFRVARTIAEHFAAENYPVHAYEVPKVDAYLAYAPYMTGVGVPLSETQDAWRDIAKRHGESISAFAETFGVDPAHVRVVEGHPGYVLPDVAKSIDADLIVMGARNLSRWQRLFTSVTVEPVLSDTPADVLVVKERHEGGPPDGRSAAPGGRPAIDIELAITEPDEVFASPREVLEAEELSVAMRRRILDAWERDIEHEMIAEDEGGPVMDVDADLVKQIREARKALD